MKTLKFIKSRVRAKLSLSEGLNLLIILGLLLLPYYVFGGKLFIGGDDTRLYYLFPMDYLTHITDSAWFTFSSSGSYNPNFFLIPLLIAIEIVRLILRNDVVVMYFFFSVPLVLGFIYFQKALTLFFARDRRNVSFTLGALLYVLSPITIVGQLDKFLYPVWLLALIPILLFHLIHFLRAGTKKDLAYAVMWSVLFSVAFYSIPWLLGMLIPVVVSLCVMGIFYARSLSGRNIKRALAFTGAVTLSQVFWLLPFINSVLIPSANSYGGQALSSETANTFSQTVLATSTGSIFYPLINFFHREIAFDFHWELADIYKHYYDFLAPLNLILPCVIFAGLIKAKQRFDGNQYRLLMGSWIALVVSLFLFTVNIGVLKDVFLALGSIPGFAMFRNAYDKFALGYIFIYSSVFCMALFAISQVAASKKRIYVLYIGVFALILANAAPIKQLINKPLWTTKNVYTTIDYPREYTDFMHQVEKQVPATASILGVPFNISSYSLVKDPTSNNVFAGRSPVKILTGRNDYVGSLSFNSGTAGLINDYIRDRDYKKLRTLLKVYGVSYIINTSNIPSEALDSYLFDPSVLDKQDDAFRSALFGRPVAKSAQGNYELYAIKDDNTAIASATTGAYSLADSQSDTTSTDPIAARFDEVLGFSSDQQPESSPIKNFSTPAYELLPGESITLGAGTYTASVNNTANASLYRDPASTMVGVKADLEYSVGDIPQRAIARAPVVPLKANDGLLVDDHPLAADEIENYTVNKNDTIRSLAFSAVNLLQSDVTFFQIAHKEDCNQYEASTGKVSFSGPTRVKSYPISLSSINAHDGCMWLETPASLDSLYRFQFDYQTNAKNLKAVVTDASGKEIMEQQLPSYGSSQWHHFAAFLPSYQTSMRLYLYSGANAASSYKNLSLYEYVPADTLSSQSAFDKLPSQYPITVPTNNTKLKYSPLVTTLDNRYYSFDSWNKADCNAVNATQSIYYRQIQGGGITLGSQNGHNACIYHDFDINPNNVYQIQVDYKKTSANHINFYIDFGKAYQPLVIPFTSNSEIKKIITPPSGATSMRVYLYSGASKTGSTSVSYQNIELSALAKYAYGNTLLSPIASTQQYQVGTQKTADYRYNLTIHSARSTFLLNLKEAFHPGWQLRFRGAAGTKVTPHLTVSNYSNGWYIDINKLCRQQHLCQQNPDGSYNLELVAEFTPQRWFNVGLAISGATLLGCVGYLGIGWYRRRSKRSVRALK
jgi:hypothetical protein